MINIHSPISDWWPGRPSDGPCGKADPRSAGSVCTRLHGLLHAQVFYYYHDLLYYCIIVLLQYCSIIILYYYITAIQTYGLSIHTH